MIVENGHSFFIPLNQGTTVIDFERIDPAPEPGSDPLYHGNHARYSDPMTYDKFIKISTEGNLHCWELVFSNDTLFPRIKSISFLEYITVVRNKLEEKFSIFCEPNKIMFFSRTNYDKSNNYVLRLLLNDGENAAFIFYASNDPDFGITIPKSSLKLLVKV